jgi:aminomethyltransferase
VALARVPLACQPGERVEVEIRDRRLQAEIVRYPFVRMGRSILPD